MVGDILVVGSEVTDPTNAGIKSSVTGGTSMSGKEERWGTVCDLFFTP